MKSDVSSDTCLPLQTCNWKLLYYRRSKKPVPARRHKAISRFFLTNMRTLFQQIHAAEQDCDSLSWGLGGSFKASGLGDGWHWSWQTPLRRPGPPVSRCGDCLSERHWRLVGGSFGHRRVLFPHQPLLAKLTQGPDAMQMIRHGVPPYSAPEDWIPACAVRRNDYRCRPARPPIIHNADSSGATNRFSPKSHECLVCHFFDLGTAYSISPAK